MKESKSFEGKLYRPKDFEGKPNVEVLGQIREIENSLSNNTAFVGLAPVGSTMRGGYSTESSNINIVILYDANPGEEDINARQDIATIMDASRGRFTSVDRRNVEMSLLNINPEAVINPFLENTQNSISKAKFIEAIAEMSLLVVGNKIKEYRRIYSEQFGKLPPIKQLDIIEEAAAFCEDKERPGTEKGEARLHPNKSVAEVIEIRKARMELWKKRLANMWLQDEDAKRHFIVRSEKRH